MRTLRILAVTGLLVVAWCAHRMRHTEWYGFDDGKQDATCGPILVKLIPNGYHDNDGIVGHTVHSDPYELNVWCNMGYKINALSDVVLMPLDGSNENIAVPGAKKPFAGKYPAPWYFCLAEPLHLKRTDYRLTGRISAESKTGSKDEQTLSIVLNEYHSSSWSNDILSGLMSE